MREGASLLNLNAALCLSSRGGRSCVSVSELQMRVGNNLLSAPLSNPLRGKCISLICNSTNRMYVQGGGTCKVAQPMSRQMSAVAPLSLNEGEKERVIGYRYNQISPIPTFPQKGRSAQSRSTQVTPDERQRANPLAPLGRGLGRGVDINMDCRGAYAL